MAGPEKNPGGGAADVAPVAAPCRNIAFYSSTNWTLCQNMFI